MVVGMMVGSLILLAGLSQDVEMQKKHAPAAAAEEAAAQPSHAATLEGPMRLDLVAVVDVRTNVTEDIPTRKVEDQLGLGFKLRGGNLKKIMRVGRHVIITEAVDDGGTSLLKPDALTEEQKNASDSISVDEAMVQQGGVFKVEMLTPPPRTARRLSSVKGYMKVHYSEGVDEVAIENPMQFAGGAISHPRLSELGVALTVYGPGTPGLPADGRAIGVAITTGEERVQALEFYDDWYKLMAVRRQPKPAGVEGEAFTIYRVQNPPGAFGADCTLVVKVHTNVTEEEVPFVLSNVELP